MSYSANELKRPLVDAVTRPAPTLDIVVPCFNEQDALPILIAHLETLGQGLVGAGLAASVRLVLVDDGSHDQTWRIIREAGDKHDVKGIRLSRNHGHQRALLAGLWHSTADVVISMDADLQDDPSAVERMLLDYRSGCDIVYGVRTSRAVDSRFKRTSARAYYGLLSRLGVDLVPDHADFRLMSRRALIEFAKFGESNLFLRGLIPHIGLHSSVVTYDRGERVAGESKYPLGKMVALAIEGVTSLSVKPLRAIVIIGLAISMLSFVSAIVALVAWAVGETVSGWTSIVVPMFFLGGINLFALGMIGEYVGKIYSETKQRPRFIVDDIVECDRKEAGRN